MGYILNGYGNIPMDGFGCGSGGCGPTCGCQRCRAQFGLAETYVPEEDDDQPESASGFSYAYGYGSNGFGQAGPPPRVVFVPGIMGSELVDGSGNVIWGTNGMRRWITNIPGWIAKMREGNGFNTSGSIRPRGLTRLSLGPINIDPYSSFVAALQSALGASNVLVVPYDWRISNEASAAHLKRTIEGRWPDAAESPGRRVTIISHSMGGLVSRWYLERLGGSRFVQRLVTVGTPHHGAPKALHALMTLPAAAALLVPAALVAPLTLALGPLLRELQKMLCNFASLYQLMPDFNFLHPSATAPAPEPVANTYRRLASDPALNSALGAPGAGRCLIRGPFGPIVRNLNTFLTVNIPALPGFLSAASLIYFHLGGFRHETVMASRYLGRVNFVEMRSRCGDATVPKNSSLLPPSANIRPIFTTSSKEHGDLFQDTSIQRYCIAAVRGAADPALGLPGFVRVAPPCPAPRTSVPVIGPLPRLPLLPTVPLREAIRRAVP